MRHEEVEGSPKGKKGELERELLERRFFPCAGTAWEEDSHIPSVALVQEEKERNKKKKGGPSLYAQPSLGKF